VDQVPVANAPATDLEGIPRPVPIAGLADMGAYEWFRAGVTLEADQSVVAEPGETVTFTLDITNDGNLPDTFGLDIPLNSQGWTAQPVSPTITLMPGATGNVYFTTTVPMTATGGTVNDLTARASSMSDGAVLDIANLQVTVADVAGVVIGPDLADKGSPTEGVKYVHTLVNNGNFTDTITLSGVSSQGWVVSAQPAVAIVPAGGSTTVTVTVSVPPNQAAGVVDVATVTADSSATAGTTSDTATDTTTIIQLAGVTLSPDNQGSGSEGTDVTYNHTVENTGNGSDTFNLSALSSQGWTVSFSQPSVTLAAGASTTIQVTISVPTGATGAVDVTTVTAASAYSPGTTATATDTTQSGGLLYLPIINKN
jgi:uncharacterized membrane protein